MSRFLGKTGFLSLNENEFRVTVSAQHPLFQYFYTLLEKGNNRIYRQTINAPNRLKQYIVENIRLNELKGAILERAQMIQKEQGTNETAFKYVTEIWFQLLQLGHEQEWIKLKNCTFKMILIARKLIICIKWKKERITRTDQERIKKHIKQKGYKIALLVDFWKPDVKGNAIEIK